MSYDFLFHKWKSFLIILFFFLVKHQHFRYIMSTLPAAAAAKSLQSCPTLQPHRRQPTRLPSPWDSPGKNTGVHCHFLLQGMKVKSESKVTQSCPTLNDPMDCSLPGSSIHGFSRQEYWSGVPLPSPKSAQCYVNYILIRLEEMIVLLISTYM